MLGNLIVSVHYPRGTFCAAIGLLVIAAYYVNAWRSLQSGDEPYLNPAAPDLSESRPWPELRYLHVAMLLSVLLFMFAGAADVGNDWLERSVGGLMGLCAALVCGMLGVVLVSLANLWKELVVQLRKARIGSLLVSTPLAFFWLALGLGALVLLGMVLKGWEWSFRELLFDLIAVAFYGLWKSRSQTALMLRLILLVSFSAITAGAVGFGLWWISSQTAPLLVILLAALGALNVIFYSRWVRLGWLKNNLY